jgi:hypothetical protein
VVERAWYPYAPDQEFGVCVAADQETLDRMIDELDSSHRRSPRPANKAPLGGEPSPPPVLAVRWAPIQFLDGPVTTATALDAAVDSRSHE